MILQVGGFSFQDGECNVRISRQSQIVNERAIEYTDRWDVEGTVIAATGGGEAVSALLSARQAAWNQPNQSLALNFSDGTPSVYTLNAQIAASGVRVVKPLDYPSGDRAQLTNIGRWSAAMEATFLSSSIAIVSFQESLDFVSNGGPVTVWQPTLYGPPIQQMTRQQTTYKCVQAGQAVGLTAYPTAPAPLFPGLEHNEQRGGGNTSPVRFGQGSNAVFKNFVTTWRYVFESDSPFFQLPTTQQQD